MAGLAVRWLRRPTRRDPPADRVLDPSPVIRGVRDPGAARALADDGYVRLGQVLTPDECTHLRRVFEEVERRLDEPLGGEWFPTILLPDADLRAMIDRELRAVVEPRLAAALDLEELNTVRIDYSVKPPGPNSHLGPHQDFSIVDERRWTSLYVWIPLVATDEHNGTLHVLPGSHRFSNRVRSRHVPAKFDPVLDEVEQHSIRLDCAPGELVVMVSGVVHHSPPNQSDALRLAVHGIFKPAAAPLVFYYADEMTPLGQVEMYEVGIDEYIELVLGDRPGSSVVCSGTCERPETEMAPERFAAGLAAFADETR